MTTIVNWTPFSGSKGDNGVPVVTELGLQVTFFEPELFFKYIVSQRDKTRYLKCYAFSETFKNAYIIKAPFDLVIQFNREKQWLSVDGISQSMYNEYFYNRTEDYGPKDPVLITALPRYVFYSDTDVQMNCLPLPLLGEPENTRLVPGGFNISKWIRPIDWTFEFVDDVKPVVVKRGDPLFLVMFNTPNNDKVVLERVEFDDRLAKLIWSCNISVKQIPQLALKKRYEMAESLLKLWRKLRQK